MTRPPRPTFVYSLVALLTWPIVYFVYRYRVRGREHLPKSGGFVLAAGHLSNFDPWPLGMGLWPHRFLRFMAKSELFWFPLGPVLSAVGAFKVYRGRGDREALRTAVDLAREGHVIAMFPEGTRRRKGLRKKREAQAHAGAAQIAIRAGVPLVPAGIRGTDGLGRLARLEVRYGAPIDLDDLRELPRGKAAHVATERLMAAIYALEAADD